MSQTTDRAARLAEEQRRLRELGDTRSFVRVEEAGLNPDGVPTEYLVTFACNGYAPGGNGGGVPCGHHEVRITCGSDFPATAPRVTFVTAIWHPHVDRHNEFTLPPEAWRAGSHLVDVCRVLYDVIRYRSYTRTPARAANPQAAQWVREVAEPEGHVNRDQGKALDSRPFPIPVSTSPERAARARVAAVHEDDATEVLAPAVEPPSPQAAPDPMLALNVSGRDLIRTEVTKTAPNGRPTEYRVTFLTAGVTHCDAHRKPMYAHSHTVLIRQEPTDAEPTAQFQTPIFHPNIPDDGRGFQLRANSPIDLCRRLYRLIGYQDYNLRAEQVRNRKAARWVDEYAEISGSIALIRDMETRPFPDPFTVPPEPTQAPNAVPRAPGAQPIELPARALPPTLPAGRESGQPIRLGTAQSAQAVPPRQGIRLLPPSPPPPVPAAASAPALAGARPELASTRPGLSVGFTALVTYELRDTTRVEVVIPQVACAGMVEHAKESNRREVEVAGFLMGTLERVPGRDADHPDLRVTVTDVLRARSRNQTVAEVEFGVEVWQELEAQSEPLERQGKVRLGWYHTHPNQGIFFSPPDLNSHLEWRQPHQFGLVIDPRNMECGLLHWTQFPPNPDDRRALPRFISAPILFALQPGLLPGGPPSRAPAPARPPAVGPVRVIPPRPPLHKLRFWGAVGVCLTVLCALGLFAGEVLTWARFPLSPQLLVALGTVSGLWVLARLWNAQFFHPNPAEPEPEGEDGELPARLLGVLLALAGLCAFGASAELLGKVPPPPVVMLLTLLFAAAAFAYLEMHLSGAFVGPGHTEQAIVAAVGRRTSATGAAFQAGAGRLWRFAAQGLRAALPVLRWVLAITLIVTAGAVFAGVVLDFARAGAWLPAGLWFGGALVLVAVAMLCVYQRESAKETTRTGVLAQPAVRLIDSPAPLTADTPNQGDHHDGTRARSEQ
ncbi:MAG TPA: ubiquitin-conjugating enzyme E2 [Gemmata sp.]